MENDSEFLFNKKVMRKMKYMVSVSIIIVKKIHNFLQNEIGISTAVMKSIKLKIIDPTRINKNHPF
ncbi:unnamed protein product [Paramecium primaurelia]|uniref:Uncharacterized protein n=1 Tax=Paramecium primaurelia TaxID=5886 RepID=A0A8S1Q006_PARPR|nr:unnamed protein product [Paramecium primaurelia]